MSTGYIYNGYGQYETNDQGEKGITLHYAGVGFWLPFRKVTAFPNYNFREVDHDKSTPQGDVKGELVYQTVRVPGERIVEELTEPQLPYPNKFKGIQKITGRRTNKLITVCEGREADSGAKLFTEVPEVEATKAEIEMAETAAVEYKKRIVTEFFQSKRERMTGNPGRLHPDPITRKYMDELGLQDNDDITAHAVGGVNPELIAAIIQATRESSDEKLVEAVKLLRADIRADKYIRAKVGPKESSDNNPNPGSGKK